jgi:serine/threonine-protein kinase SRPK3
MLTKLAQHKQVMEFVQGIVLFSGKASENGTWTAEDDHLARIAEVLGPFPSSLLKRGRLSSDFFDEQGMLYMSIARPLCSHANVCKTAGKLIRIRNLKPTSLERLLNGQVKPFIKPRDMPEAEIGAFIDFIKGMLEIDPMSRKSAAELLQHEWIRPS